MWQALDTLAINLPAKHVLPEVLIFAKAVGHSSSPDQQVAACLVVAVVAEGACEAVRKRINEVLQVRKRIDQTAPAGFENSSTTIMLLTLVYPTL